MVRYPSRYHSLKISKQENRDDRVGPIATFVKQVLQTRYRGNKDPSISTSAMQSAHGAARRRFDAAILSVEQRYIR